MKKLLVIFVLLVGVSYAQTNDTLNYTKTEINALLADVADGDTSAYTVAKMDTILGKADTLLIIDTTLPDIADGTIAENLVNTANPWADNEVADNITASSYAPLASPTFTGAVTHAGIKVQTHSLTTDSTLDAALCYGGVFYVPEAQTITLPAVASGMSLTFITVGAVAVSINPNDNDLMYLDGTSLANGDKATNTSTTGDIIIFTYYSGDGWYAISGSNDGDPWTDTN